MNATDIVTITPGFAHGRVVIPPSKSVAHRALICAALASEGSISRLSGMPYNQDIDATMDCLRTLGVRMTDEREAEGVTRCVTVFGCGGQWTKNDEPLPCRESGSTLRFMLPLCLLSDAPRTLKGSRRLLARPLDDYRELFEGREWVSVEGGLRIGGGSVLQGQTFSLSGKSSSQFITGLLFVLPLLGEDSVIELPGIPESKSYIDMTIAMQARFGVIATWQDDTHLVVKGRQSYRAADMTADGDASGAAFFYALDALKSNGEPLDIVCVGSDDVRQGDAICPSLLAQLATASPDQMPVISLADCPDLGPILFTAAAAKCGAIFTHTDRLRLKESDRISAMVQELEKFGARFEIIDGIDGGRVTVLSPEGGLRTPKSVLHGHNDHRVVMSLAVLSACMSDPTPICIDDAHAVTKSFPDFFDRLQGLGIDCRLT